MIENLKKALKEDLWNVIDGKKLQPREDKIFINYVFYLLLERKTFKMEDVLKMAKSLKEKYEAMLEKFDDLLLDDLGNIEKTLKAIFNGYDEEMEQLKNKILMMKNGRQEQGTGSTEINS